MSCHTEKFGVQIPAWVDLLLDIFESVDDSKIKLERHLAEKMENMNFPVQMLAVYRWGLETEVVPVACKKSLKNGTWKSAGGYSRVVVALPLLGEIRTVCNSVEYQETGRSKRQRKARRDRWK